MSGRIQIHSMYFRLAERQAERHDAILPEMNELQAAAKSDSDLFLRLAHLDEERKHCAVICVTFCGMALEAFFFDYAASKLGDNFVDKHLDKLDVKSKYLIYPLMVCGKAPDKSHSTYAALEKLVKLRNDLVHFKSINMHPSLDKAVVASDELDERLWAGVAESPKTVLMVMEEMDRLHGRQSAFRLEMVGSGEA